MDAQVVVQSKKELKLEIHKVKANVVEKQKSGWSFLRPSAFY